jgi:hypothetical protein
MQQDQMTEKRPWIKPTLRELPISQTESQKFNPGGDGINQS